MSSPLTIVPWCRTLGQRALLCVDLQAERPQIFFKITRSSLRYITPSRCTLQIELNGVARCLGVCRANGNSFIPVACKERQCNVVARISFAVQASCIAFSDDTAQDPNRGRVARGPELQRLYLGFVVCEGPVFGSRWRLALSQPASVNSEAPQLIYSQSRCAWVAPFDRLSVFIGVYTARCRTLELVDL